MSLFAYFLWNSVKPICYKVKQHLGFLFEHIWKWYIKGLVPDLWSIQPTQMTLEGQWHLLKFLFCKMKQNEIKWNEKKQIGTKIKQGFSSVFLLQKLS